MKLLTTRIATIAPDLPVVVTRDFNTVPDTPTWRVLNGAFHDAWLAAAKRTGPAATFHNFTGTPDRRIDWIFARGFTVTRAMTITDHRGAVYPSDYYPVVATLSYTRPDTP